ncbi:SagB/ThcOx family dehydrogenase [Methanohalophilus mahii]|uniref:SagB-type dehydrogenase domain protein n=1 Tax=Methanohalophilus mahii (strain ATCC 35705 / DSM 5219 / SLP) TaxID=547558 RepID=D5E955_METMS|nr:SagB/ThcOx family dehydrogenase [Methanohalophilus mahii]ADE35706.1 SagB-type dehydrogenase domain protein [Methanohalophilus mahii DSM 5219]
MTGEGKRFMEATRFGELDPSPQMLGRSPPPLEIAPDADRSLISLPEVDGLEMDSVDLKRAIEARRSIRNFTGSSLSLQDLAWLLWATQGVKKVMDDVATFRTVPSAGARHSFETYLSIGNVEGLEQGLYRYLALEHSIVEEQQDENIMSKVAHACLDQSFVHNCGAVFIWVAISERMGWRYGERGYRYLHLDAGHVCQNLYLASQAVKCGVCAVAAFKDDELNSLLGLDGDKHFVVYLAAVGKRD